MSHRRSILCLFTFLPTLLAATTQPSTQPTTWNGYDRQNFIVDGRDCLLIQPHAAAEGNPWIWRTEFFGNEPQADVALLSRGFAVACMNVQNMYGAPVALDHMDAFYKELTQNYGLSKKTVLEGFSRGGLFAFNWAARNPNEVAALYVDAPVCDFKSWPGEQHNGKYAADWARLKLAYGFKSDEEAFAYKLNPIDNLAPLAAAHIPILAVCGDADTLVPYLENTAIVATRYKALGGSITVIIKPGADHHPHSLKEPTPIVDFVVDAVKNAGSQQP